MLKLEEDLAISNNKKPSYTRYSMSPERASSDKIEN